MIRVVREETSPSPSLPAPQGWSQKGGVALLPAPLAFSLHPSCRVEIRRRRRVMGMSDFDSLLQPDDIAEIVQQMWLTSCRNMMFACKSRKLHFRKAHSQCRRLTYVSRMYDIQIWWMGLITVVRSVRDLRSLPRISWQSGTTSKIVMRTFDWDRRHEYDIFSAR